MADNTQLNVGAGGDLIKTEDMGAYKVAVSKIYVGDAGLDGGPVTATNPFPVSVTNVAAVQAVTVETLPLPAGAATAAKQPALGAAGTPAADVLTVQGAPSMTPIKVDGSATTQPVSGSVSVSNFPASQTIAGAVSVSNFPATQTIAGAVSVSNFPASQAVTVAVLPLPAGAATAAKQPALGAAGTPAADVLTVQGAPSMTPIKVDGSATTQPVSGSVSVSNFPASQTIAGAVSVTGLVSTTANLSVSGSAVAVGNPVPVAMVGGLPAGTTTIGAVISQLTTGVIYDGSASLVPKFAVISASTSGDNTLVPSVPGKKIRVLKYTVVTSGAVGVKFRSSAGGDITGSMSLAANSGIGGAFSPIGHFETGSGEALQMNLSGAIGVAGHLTYIEV